ncbi:MAG: leucine-rich repeat domain-containing protein, partial [Clostridia bacterium]|nr:leucine-rich repeat domain-containing protein [Clostridia bacterium]
EFEDIDTLKYIGDYAFFGTGIKNFVGGESLEVIGQYAFQRCLSLEWVDLSKTKIVNTKNGSIKTRDMFKYEYELKDEKDDYRNYFGYGIFKGCRNLAWIYLPRDIRQIPTAAFTNCVNLETVIIPTKKDHINASTSATDDDAFYQYGQPRTVFEPSTVYKLTLVVDAGAVNVHEDLFDGPEYLIMSDETTKRPE